MSSDKSVTVTFKCEVGTNVSFDVVRGPDGQASVVCITKALPSTDSIQPRTTQSQEEKPVSSNPSRPTALHPSEAVGRGVGVVLRRLANSSLIVAGIRSSISSPHNKSIVLPKKIASRIPPVSIGSWMLYNYKVSLGGAKVTGCISDGAQWQTDVIIPEPSKKNKSKIELRTNVEFIGRRLHEPVFSSMLVGSVVDCNHVIQANGCPYLSRISYDVWVHRLRRPHGEANWQIVRMAHGPSTGTTVDQRASTSKPSVAHKKKKNVTFAALPTIGLCDDVAAIQDGLMGMSVVECVKAAHSTEDVKVEVKDEESSTVYQDNFDDWDICVRPSVFDFEPYV